MFAVLFQWRSALFRLALKELKVRYKSPVLGLLWAFAVPLMTSLVLAFIFGKLVPVPFVGVPYFLFLIAAVFPWNCLQATLIAATTCIQDNGSLIRRAYFPRQLIPCSILVANLANFLITLVVVCGVVWASGRSLSALFWLLPCAVILQVVLLLGLSLILSAWQAQYRDTKYLVEVSLLLWFYVTPIIYPSAAIASFGSWTTYAILANPVAGLVSLYRIALLGWSAAGLPVGVTLPTLLSWTVATTLACGFLGWRIFSQSAPKLADLVQG